ncbi:MAG: adenylyltransferase/cytidyltransferase family protein, partial [Pseudobutyrivibrio sp.]|nr:adenylyltransferase/cytidyltransferase family protein [Pseudobutyrivibrio sp.]
LEDYYKSIRKEPNVVFNNREHMNYAAEDYSRLFENIFRDAKYRNLIIFGAGAYAKNFLTRFGDRFNVVAAIDNNSANWGKKIYPQGFGDNNDGGKGVPVKGPDFLLAQGHGTYKVIVCIKNNSQIMKQLNDMGIHEFSIYDPAKEYPLPIEETVATNNSIHDKKKYHIGYVSGAFDLFHIGHLNLLKRAKEYCDYLIVGVMSDEAIQQYKNATPFVTYDERAEIVMACKYVDQVEKIPFAMGGADEAWKQFHFDVLFCGSDYEGNQGRMREKKFLEEHGATVEIFPYTQSTSSSQIREMIEKKLV